MGAFGLPQESARARTNGYLTEWGEREVKGYPEDGLQEELLRVDLLGDLWEGEVLVEAYLRLTWRGFHRGACG